MMMGPPGAFRQENSLYLAEQMGWKCITTGDLLRKEVMKKSELGKKIQDSFKNYQYGKLEEISNIWINYTVEDKIVIDIVTKEIEVCESEK